MKNSKQWTVAENVTEIKEKTADEQHGVVYAVEYGDRIKIGFTKDLINRVKNFLGQTKYSEVAIGRIAYTPYHSNCQENERILHSAFTEFRTHGTELFDITLNKFLSKVPHLEFDKTVFDYQGEIKALIEMAKQNSNSTNEKGLIQIYEDKALPAREYNGTRVITFKDVDYLHGRPDGTARRNFNKNKNRFFEGSDYFIAKQSDILMYAFRTLEIPNRGLTLITESGYMILVKSFTDDLSWIIQRALVLNYFKKPSEEKIVLAIMEQLFKNKEKFNVERANNINEYIKAEFLANEDEKEEKDDMKKINEYVETAFVGEENSPAVTATTEEKKEYAMKITSIPRDYIVSQSDNKVNGISKKDKNIFDASSVPQSLRELNQWVVWKYLPNPDKPDKPRKVPVNPHNGNNAQSNNPATWGSLEEACAALRKYSGAAGLGFMFANGVCGIDIDNKEKISEREKQALKIIKAVDSYAEYSPSGTGYHIIFRFDSKKLPANYKELYYQKNDRYGLECYFSGQTNRFFTFTGKAITDFGIEERTAQILKFLDDYMLRSPQQDFKKPMGTAEPSAPPAPSNNTCVNYDPLLMARKAKNSAKFSALYDSGNISMYNNDDSAADQALCCMLAFYCRGNFDEIDRLFRQSALYRQKWEREDYRTATINKAINLCRGKFYELKRMGRPKKNIENQVHGQHGNENGTAENANNYMISIEAVRRHLEAKKIELKYNVITRRVDVTGFDGGYDDESKIDILPIALHDELKFIYTRCPKDSVIDSLHAISSANRYNPVLEMLDSAKWDGEDRINKIFGILHIEPSDTLSQTLIYKWLWQCLSMARNELRNAYGADGLLVMQGRQGIGKTSFVRHMAVNPKLCLIGKKLDFRDKDTIRRCGSAWLVELGEIETTFKSDKEALKAFITDEIDMYRLPYGRADVELARRASLIGTCNSNEYLIDETGNRRFWTVPIKEIDLGELRRFDALQLWIQIDMMTKDNRQGFRLTKNEQNLLASRNGIHEKPLKGEIEIRDIFALLETDDRYELTDVTVTEFKMAHDALRNYNSNQISQVLNKMGIEVTRNRKYGSDIKLRKLPMRKFGYITTEMVFDRQS